MLAVRSCVRRGLLAAMLAFGATGAVAQVTATYDAQDGAITVVGLDQAPEAVALRVAGLEATQSMPVTVTTHAGAFQITPRFALRAGTAYDLRLTTKGRALRLAVALPEPEAPRPELTGFAPAQAVIPENTLRLYLTFSEPMARGTLRATLLREDGSVVTSPFLTLGPELWDPAQRRVTLLFDPGRIKQGVGPNLTHGAPLVAGERYQLVIDGALTSAAGTPLGQDLRIAFRAGPAERRPIDPSAWQVEAPPSGSRAPLSLAFDRIMDSGALRRLVTLRGPDGAPVRGTLETDGGGWSLHPDRPWQAGTYRITVDPALEDVSGNALGQGFDAAAGTMGTTQPPAILEVQI